MKRGILLRLTAVSLVLAVSIGLFSNALSESANAVDSTTLSASEIVNKLVRAGYPIKNVIIYTEETDPNTLLGRPSQYTSKVNFEDTRAPVETADNTIEVFNTISDCQERADYINSLNAGFVQQYVYSYGNVLLRITFDLLPTHAEAYSEAVSVIVKGESPKAYIDPSSSPTPTLSPSPTPKTSATHTASPQKTVAPTPNNSGKSVLEQITESFGKKIPYRQSTLMNDASGKILYIYLEDDTNTSNMLKYVLTLNNVCVPFMGKGKIREVQMLITDEWGDEAFVYTTKGAAYGKTIDRRTGKKVTKKFETLLDLYRAYPIDIPEAAELAAESNLSLLNEALIIMQENPKHTGKKVIKQLAKDENMKYDDALLIINQTISSLFLK